MRTFDADSPHPRGPRQPLVEAALPFVGVGAFLLVWWIGAAIIPPPSSIVARFAPDQTAAALVQILVSGRIWPHLIASVRRVVIGLALSVAVGFPLGLAIGEFRRVGRLTGPIFQFVRMVSPLSWSPLAIILLGVGDAPVYFLIAIAAVWPIVLNTAAGVAALDPRWLLVGRSLGANQWEIARTIVWPGIRPNVLTGLRLSVGLAWIVLVPAEMLGVDSGLGYFILDTRDRLAYPELMAAIIVIGSCGFLIDSIARWLFRERRSAARFVTAATGGEPVLAEAPSGQPAASSAPGAAIRPVRPD